MRSGSFLEHIDSVVKYFCLLICMGYVGVCIYFHFWKKLDVNLPDWIVMIITIIIQYFFRRSPKLEEGNNGKVPNGSQG